MECTLAIIESITSALREVDLLPEFDTTRGVFCAIAWIATLLSLGLFVISLFADFGSDADAGGDAGADGETGMFSLRACMGLLLGFGWGGYCASQSGMTAVPASLIGLLVGGVMFFIVAALMKFIYSLRADGTLDHSTLVGYTGTVYISIPPQGEPGGQVQIAHPSQLVTIAAVQEGDKPLPAQTRVVVTAATSGQVTVKPL